MSTLERAGRRRLARGDLFLLLLAAVASVAVLVVAAVDVQQPLFGTFALGKLLLGVVLAGAGTALLMVIWQNRLGSGWLKGSRRREISDLKRNLAAVESVLKAEPQVLILWPPGEPARIPVHTLTSISGLPEDPAQLLRFGVWLEPTSAHDLKNALDALFAAGRPFTLLLRTCEGADVEADGRVSGGRALLRLRDIAGYRRDLARIMEQHRHLARDIGLGRALYNALPHPVWVRGPRGNIEWVNKAYAKAVGARDETDVIDRQLELLEARQRDELASMLGKGEALKRRMPLIIAGERRHHDIVVQTFGEASVACAIDVTALENVESERDRLIAAYDRTLHRVSTAVAIFARDGRLSFFNDAFAKLWRLDPDWLAERPHHGEILDRLRERGRLPAAINYRSWREEVVSASRAQREREEWWHLPDGVSLKVMAEERPDGGITYLYHDATEQLALEGRYNALISVQRETLDQLAEGVAVFGTDGRLKLSNVAFRRIWKLGRNFLEDTPHVDEIIRQCRVLHEDRHAWEAIGQAVTVLSDHRQPTTGQMTRSDGSVIDYSVLPLPDGGTLVSFADVTVSKRYERALIERNEALVAADRLKSQFISHVSYELRTPLTSIIGFADLLRSPRTGELNTKQSEYLAAIRASSEALESTINDILDLTNIDAGALELRLAPANVRAIIEQATLAVRDRMARTNLKLEVHVDEDVDELIVDEARLRQILYNLLSNAIGFSKPGGSIKLEAVREEPMIAFTIRDEGAGIPRDQQRDVLGRFVSRSRGSKHRGAGLGLPIVKSLVDLHGGTMALESEPGQGTAVTVRFPRMGPPTAAAAKKDVPQSDEHPLDVDRT